MKTVLRDNATVAHYWAHQLQPEGRTSTNNFSFVGPKLYSYQTCIGFLDGETVILTNKSYSMTTSSKHQPAARSAVSHLQLISVSVDLDFDINNRISLDIWAIDALDDIAHRLETLKGKVQRSRTNKGLRMDYFQANAVNMENLIEWVNQKLNGRWSDELVQAVSDARKAADEPEEWGTLREELAEQRRQYEEEQEKRQQEAIVKWKRFELIQPVWGTDKAYLRMMPDGDVQTSKGVEISWRDAVTGYKAFKTGRLLGAKLAGYTVTQIDRENELVIAGCHKVPFSEIEEIGKALEKFTPPVQEVN